MKMNHDLIESLVELYLELPEKNPETAAQRVAVLIDIEMSEMEAAGEAITRDSLLKRVKHSLEKHKKWVA